MLSVSHLSFAYSGKNILDDLSFDVATGEIVALWGPNGVGKTTLVKVLAGIYLPRSGRIVVDGVDSADSPMRYRRQIGYMGDEFPLYGDMTVKDFLYHRARLKGEKMIRVRYRVREAFEDCNLESLAKTSIRFLSQGQRKRVALADAILLRPRLLLLDDVVAGIDDESRASVISALKTVSATSTVIVTGHERECLSKFVTRFMEFE